MIPRVCHLTYLQSAKAAKAAKDWDDAQLASNLDECKIAEAKDVKTPAAAAKVCSLDIPLPAVDALLDLSYFDCWRIGDPSSRRGRRTRTTTSQSAHRSVSP